MNKKMSVPPGSVVIPAYNAAATLGDCLTGLLAQQGVSNLEIIVVDDGSTDHTASVVRRFAAQGVQLVQIPHRGAAAARNAGVRASSSASSVILFTDADCIPAPGWASALGLRMAGASPQTVGVKGVYRTKQTSLVARFAQLEFEERYRRLCQPSQPLDFADTYSAAYDRPTLLAQPFDETLPGAIVEDAELGWRLRRAGRSFAFEPGAVVYHQHPPTLWRYWQRKGRIARWRILIYRRYPDRLAKDSHTSQAAKGQMLLLAGALGATLMSWSGLPSRVTRPARPCALLAWLALELSFSSFVWQAWKSDPPVALVAWPLLNLRTSAWLAGASVGLAQAILEKLARFAIK